MGQSISERQGGREGHAAPLLLRPPRLIPRLVLLLLLCVVMPRGACRLFKDCDPVDAFVCRDKERRCGFVTLKNEDGKVERAFEKNSKKK